MHRFSEQMSPFSEGSYAPGPTPGFVGHKQVNRGTSHSNGGNTTICPLSIIGPGSLAPVANSNQHWWHHYAVFECHASNHKRLKQLHKTNLLSKVTNLETLVFYDQHRSYSVLHDAFPANHSL
jgi:hypothetical protein